MKQLCFILLLAFTANGCKYNNENLSPDSAKASPQSVSISAAATNAGNIFEDGSYCATIQYNNSDNQISSTCNLSVEVKSNKLVKINSSDCGALNEINFAEKNLNETGSATFTGNKGNKYIITINEKMPLGSKRFQCDVCGKDIR